MFILGIDPSINSAGWSKLKVRPNEPPELVESGRVRTKTEQPETFRYIIHRQRYRQLIDDRRLDAVAAEQPPPSSRQSAGLYPIFYYVKTTALKYRIDIAHFTPSPLKADARRILGKSGRSTSKKEMSRAAAQLLRGDHDSIQHDIADSIHAAYRGARLLQLVYGDIQDDDLTDYEDKSFLKIVNHRKGTKTYKRNGPKSYKGDIYKEGDDLQSTYTLFSTPKYDYLY